MVKQTEIPSCLVTGKLFPAEQMIRFVIDEQGLLIADINEQLLNVPGVYVYADKNVIKEALGSGVFNQAFNCEVKADLVLLDKIAMRLQKGCLQILNFARKSGCLIEGYDKVKTLLDTKKDIAYLIQASDGSVAEKFKLSRKAGTVPVIEIFDSEQLAQLVSKERVVHMVLLEHPLAKIFRQHLNRLQQFLGEVPVV